MPEDLLPNGEPWLAPEKKAECLKKHATLLLPTVAAAEEQPATLSQTINAAAESLVTLGVSETTEVQSSSDLQASSASSLFSEDQSQCIRTTLSKLRKNCPVFRVLVIGRTGVGKYTLNNLLGKEVASVGHTLKSEWK